MGVSWLTSGLWTPAHDQSAKGRGFVHNHIASINRRAHRNPKSRHEWIHDMTKCRTLPWLQSQEFRHGALVVKFNRPYGQPWTPLAWIWQSLLGKQAMQIGPRRDVYLETKYIHSDASGLAVRHITNNVLNHEVAVQIRNTDHSMVIIVNTSMVMPLDEDCNTLWMREHLYISGKRRVRM